MSTLQMLAATKPFRAIVLIDSIVRTATAQNSKATTPLPAVFCASENSTGGVDHARQQ